MNEITDEVVDKIYDFTFNRENNNEIEILKMLNFLMIQISYDTRSLLY